MHRFSWFILLISVVGCREKYNAPVRPSPGGYLVVEGFINAGFGSTDFTLSRTTGLDSPYILPETGAVVAVESSDGNHYPLTDLGNGRYSIPQVNVDPALTYRLHIHTARGSEYLSDTVSPKMAPPVDSLSWKASADGVWIYVTTHDDSDNSRYYQWKFEETWEYNSAFISSLEYAGGGKLVPRPLSEQVYVCYLSSPSSSIAVGSSEKLQRDIIQEFPLLYIPYATTNRLERKYSILVKQYALSKEWYEWEQKVKKNTEELGSIFDAQPSDISGNLHSLSDPSEPVIGYVGCSSETEKRIFIDRTQLPQAYIFTGYEDCEQDTLPNDVKDIEDAFDNGLAIPLSGIYHNGFLVAITAGSTFCVDCRIMGGVLTRPDFWQ
jgi:hypothetical protein